VRRSDHSTENIALAVLALIVAMIAVYAFVTNKEASDNDQQLAALMPANYEPTLAALIRAGGNECDRICSAEVRPGATGVRIIRAACTAPAQQGDCAHALNYDLTITPSAQPTR
jgi:hypothetical protein